MTMTQHGSLAADRFVASFDENSDAWTLEATSSGSVVSLVAIVLGGLRWTVDVADPSRPVRVDVDSPPSPFAEAALRSLLGPEVQRAMDGSHLGGPVPFDLGGDHESVERRAAMGRLALASAFRPTPRDFSPARTLDVGALTHRAGLDVLAAPLPGHAELAHAALEVLDLVPQRVVETVNAPPVPELASAWLQVRFGLADLVALIRRSSEALLASIDVETEAGTLLGEIEEVFDATFRPEDILGRERDQVGVFGDDARPPSVLLLCGTARGLVASDSALVDGRLVVRVDHVGSLAPPALLARVLSPERDRLLAIEPLNVSAVTGRGRHLEATFDLGEVRLGDVEIVLDADHPVVGHATARQIDADTRVLEAYRQLQRRAGRDADRSLEGSIAREEGANAAKKLLEAATDSLDMAGTGGPLSTPRDLLPHGIHPLPSDGLVTVIERLADELVTDVEAYADAGSRAAQACLLADLVDDLDSPALVPMIARLRLVQAAGHRVLGPAHRRAARRAIDRAATAAALSGNDELLDRVAAESALIEADER